MRLDKEGYRIHPQLDGTWERVLACGEGGPIWYVPGLPVWEFDLYFLDSRRYYDTEYVRARDNRQAKRKIKRLYWWVERFEFGESYAD